MRVVIFVVDLCIAFMIGASIALALNFCHLQGRHADPSGVAVSVYGAHPARFDADKG
jgi:Mg2+/citrate symporter